MINAIIKKVTSTNVSKVKLQAIANILDIKITKSEIQKDIQTNYLEKIKREHQEDEEQYYIDQIKAEQLLDEIELAKGMALLKPMSKKTPRQTVKKAVVQSPKDSEKEQPKQY